MGGRLEIGSDPPGAQVALDGASKGVTPLVLNDVTRWSAPRHGVCRRQHRQPYRDGDARRHGGARDFDGACHGEQRRGLAHYSGARRHGNSRGRPGARQHAHGAPDAAGRLAPHRAGKCRAGVHRPRTVQVGAGKTANVAISLPSGKLAVNAVPWADVFMDGASLGTTRSVSWRCRSARTSWSFVIRNWASAGRPSR